MIDSSQIQAAFPEARANERYYFVLVASGTSRWITGLSMLIIQGIQSALSQSQLLPRKPRLLVGKTQSLTSISTAPLPSSEKKTR
jgi:hypothetical protein